jgi:hypothetical protein
MTLLGRILNHAHHEQKENVMNSNTNGVFAQPARSMTQMAMASSIGGYEGHAEIGVTKGKIPLRPLDTNQMQNRSGG